MNHALNPQKPKIQCGTDVLSLWYRDESYWWYLFMEWLCLGTTFQAFIFFAKVIIIRFFIVAWNVIEYISSFSIVRGSVSLGCVHTHAYLLLLYKWTNIARNPQWSFLDWSYGGKGSDQQVSVQQVPQNKFELCVGWWSCKISMKLESFYSQPFYYTFTEFSYF
jgi:hypothetical protein